MKAVAPCLLRGHGHPGGGGDAGGGRRQRQQLHSDGAPPQAEAQGENRTQSHVTDPGSTWKRLGEKKVHIRVFEVFSTTIHYNGISCKGWNAKCETTNYSGLLIQIIVQ